MFEIYNREFKSWNGQDLIFALREGTADYNSIQASVVEDEYGLKDFKFEDNDVILDIGAETGGEALTLACMNPTLNILSFEPIPENYELIKVNMMLNDIFNIRPFLWAVGGKDGMMDIFYGAMDSESGKHHHFIGNPLNVPRGDKIEAHAISLESIFKIHNLEHVKLLKLDPEGAEVDILKEAPAEILEKIDWIIGEHHDRKRGEMLELCKGLFIDEPCAWQTDVELGHFRFKNKKLN